MVRYADIGQVEGLLKESRLKRDFLERETSVGLGSSRTGVSSWTKYSREETKETVVRPEVRRHADNKWRGRCRIRIVIQLGKIRWSEIAKCAHLENLANPRVRRDED